MAAKPWDPVFVVHSLDHACAALAAGVDARRAIVLLSAPWVTSGAGAAWFRHLTDQARARFSTRNDRVILDCGECSGHAWKALRDGWKEIIVAGPALPALRDLARRHDARIVARPRRVCDLARFDDAAYAARRYVESCRGDESSADGGG